MNVIFDRKKYSNDYKSFSNEALRALLNVMINTVIVYSIPYASGDAIKVDVSVVFSIARELERRRLEHLTDADIIEWQRTHVFTVARPGRSNGGQFILKYYTDQGWEQALETNSCDYREVFFKAIRKGDYK